MKSFRLPVFWVVLFACVTWNAHAVPLQEISPGCITAGAPSDEPGKLNVHIVAHTHDDVGWLKTVDQYYYGANNSIQHASVQYILDTVVAQMLENPDRKFTYVEQAFFQRWWTEQSPSMKDVVRRLVKSGQLQFINGGWSMHDEACTHYISMVENTAFGHRFLKEQFGYIPRVGWQVDPFGHSATQATLLSAEAGFEALYFARIDFQEAKHRISQKTMEMIWRPSETLGANAEVFTGAFLSGSYGPPPGFCFDGIKCEQTIPVMDDLCMEDVNTKWYVDTFVKAAQAYAQDTAGGSTSAQNIMFLMGSDFQYENADSWYKNLDKIIHHVNKDGRVNAFYSTPNEYTDAKFKEQLEFSVKTDDFMPHADSENAYWTGFFSSRPTLKRYERVQAGYLQAARQLQLFADLAVNAHVTAQLRQGKPWYRYWFGIDRHDMDPLAAAVALTQHHDAITGTEKQHVAYDYAARLAAGGAVADLAVEQAVARLARLEAGSEVVLCKLLNETVCEASDEASKAGRPFSLLLYNPLSQPRSFPVRLPVASKQLAVTDADSGAAIASSVVDATKIASPLQALQNQAKASKLELVFNAQLAPFQLKAFVVKPTPSGASPALKSEGFVGAEAVADGKDVTIENERVSVTFDGSTGLLKTVANKEDGTSIQVSQNFFYYKSASAKKCSGAYIFRPNHTADGQDIPCASDGCGATLEVVRSSAVSEVRQVFSDWVTQTVRVYAGRLEVEMEWTVGPIPTHGLGKEVISRFSSNIASGSAMSTDSNGRDMLVRHRCKVDAKVDAACRPSVPSYNVSEPVAGNFFPVNTQAMISDERGAMTVSVDRSQAAASLAEGQMEFMVHRRVLLDDHYGVGEPLNETQSISPYDWEDDQHRIHHKPYRIGKGLVARGKHLLTVTSAATAARAFRALQSEVYFEPVLAVVPSAQQGGASFRGLRAALPSNVEIITIEKQPDASVLMRVAHKFGVNEDDELAIPVEIALSTLFLAAHLAKPSKIVELNLTANQSRKAMLARRRRFKAKGDLPSAKAKFEHFDAKPFGADATIMLAPLQIRTFQLFYAATEV